MMDAMRGLFSRRHAQQDGMEQSGALGLPSFLNEFGNGDMQNEAQLEGEPQVQVIDKKQISEARALMEKYKAGKQSLDKAIVDNERWYRLRNTPMASKRERGEAQNTSAWLFNAIANKHADIMDNFPSPVIAPREQSDEAAAKALTDILPAVLEHNAFERTYSDAAWYKVKHGTAVYGVFFDSSKNNGIGDISVLPIDIINLFWEPGITDIQTSRNVFLVQLVPNEVLEDTYPELKGKLGGKDFHVAEYVMDDNVDTSHMSVVVDWYYKRRVGQREVLHFCKFCGDEVLFASENDPQYAESGYYDHGKYPFVLDTLYPMAGSPAGFGVIEVGRAPQQYIDALDTVILKNAMINARARYFVRMDGSVNPDEFADTERDFVRYTGGGSPQDSVMPIQAPPLPAITLNVRQAKTDEIKEVTGNRDFSQGGTSSGVTAASAIAALQEAGNKLSRDMIKRSYFAFEQVCTLCIELMRQFYTEERYFRVTAPNGMDNFVPFSNANIKAQKEVGPAGLTIRMPIFDVIVHAQKASPFSVAAQNERAKELYAMGFFLPQNADQSLAALDMMAFDGIEKVKQRIAQNGTMFQMLQMLQQEVLRLRAERDVLMGGNSAQAAAELFAGQRGAPAITGGRRGETEVNALGEAVGKTQGETAGGARAKAARSATPR